MTVTDSCQFCKRRTDDVTTRPELPGQPILCRLCAWISAWLCAVGGPEGGGDA